MNTSLTFNNMTSMTLNSCAESCATQGYRYAGVYIGVKCHCGKELIVCSKESCTSTNNNLRCGGDANQFCGSHNTITILDTDDATRQSFKHLGCYVDNPSARDLPHLALNSTSMTLQLCTDTCLSLGYRYAGIQEGNRCYCGQTFGKYGVFPAQQHGCGSFCAGDKMTICGDKNANTITDNGLLIRPNTAQILMHAVLTDAYMSQRTIQALQIDRRQGSTLREARSYCTRSCLGQQSCTAFNIRPSAAATSGYACELLRTAYWKKDSAKKEAGAIYWEMTQ